MTANEHASWYYKSDEQVAAYKAIGLQHPDQVFDQNYNEFLMKTAKSPEELNQNIIHSMARVQTETGEEKLVYQITERRFDGLGNEHNFFRSNLGMFYRPLPEYRMRKDQFGYEEKYVHSVKGRRVQYSLPFNKKNVEKLRGNCHTEQEMLEAAEKREKLAEDSKMVVNTSAGSGGATTYVLKKNGFRGTMQIVSYEDWLTGDFNTLWKYGKANPTKDEREKLDEYNGTAAAAMRMSQQQDGNSNPNVNPTDIMEKVKDAVDHIKKNKMVKEPYK
jgi:hypothetical protein